MVLSTLHISLEEIMSLTEESPRGAKYHQALSNTLLVGQLWNVSAVWTNCIGFDWCFANKVNKQGVCQSHCGLAIYIKKYLMAKEEFWKHSNISPCKKYNVQKTL